MTGPYAKEILENRLGAPKGSVLNFVPLPDFGGHPSRPEPRPCQSALTNQMMGDDAPDFGAAPTAMATVT